MFWTLAIQKHYISTGLQVKLISTELKSTMRFKIMLTSEAEVFLVRANYLRLVYLKPKVIAVCGLHTSTVGLFAASLVHTHTHLQFYTHPHTHTHTGIYIHTYTHNQMYIYTR